MSTHPPGTSQPPAPLTPGRGLVVVVEDEPSIADLETLYLTRDGFGVHVERDGRRGLDAVRALRPVAVVLDVALPTMDGMAVCRALRAEGDWTPVLMVTAREEEVDRVLGLELGADDYLVKPFSPRELVARVHAVLRRGPAVGSTPALVVGSLRLEPATRRVTVGTSELTLTPTEFALLEHLMRRPGQVFSREQLLSAVWGYAAAGGTRTVDVHVGQVRAKLGDHADLVRTVRGVGYAVAAR